LSAGAVSKQKVRIRSLDAMAIEPADFWKVDVEGAELELLRGAATTLRTAAPRLVQIEIFSVPYNKKGHQPSVIAELSKTFRYHWLAGLTASEELALFHPIIRSTRELEEARAASRRGGAPTFIFSNEPLGPEGPVRR
jgi:hypothetical protein